jgi:hypothetical protein
MRERTPKDLLANRALIGFARPSNASAAVCRASSAKIGKPNEDEKPAPAQIAAEGSKVSSRG